MVSSLRSDAESHRTNANVAAEIFRGSHISMMEGTAQEAGLPATAIKCRHFQLLAISYQPRAHEIDLIDKFLLLSAGMSLKQFKVTKREVQIEGPNTAKNNTKHRTKVVYGQFWLLETLS